MYPSPSCCAGERRVRFYAPVTEVIAGELQKIGINLTIKELTFNQWIALANGPKTYGDPDINFNPDSPDASPSPERMLGRKNVAVGEYSSADYDPPVIDTLLKEGITTLGPAKRLAIYAKMLKILAADEPYVPLCQPEYNVAFSNKFTWPGFNWGKGSKLITLTWSSWSSTSVWPFPAS
jgi:ABC-type transport system substrate-binding protein